MASVTLSHSPDVSRMQEIITCREWPALVRYSWSYSDIAIGLLASSFLCVLSILLLVMSLCSIDSTCWWWPSQCAMVKLMFQIFLYPLIPFNNEIPNMLWKIFKDRQQSNKTKMISMTILEKQLIFSWGQMDLRTKCRCMMITFEHEFWKCFINSEHMPHYKRVWTLVQPGNYTFSPSFS